MTDIKNLIVLPISGGLRLMVTGHEGGSSADLGMVGLVIGVRGTAGIRNIASEWTNGIQPDVVLRQIAGAFEKLADHLQKEPIE